MTVPPEGGPGPHWEPQPGAQQSLPSAWQGQPVPPGWQPSSVYQRPPGPPRKGMGPLGWTGISCSGFVFLVIVIVVIAAAASSGGSPSGSSSASSPAGGNAGSAAQAAVAPGQVARDGDFAFTLEGATCGKSAARAVTDSGYGEKVPADATECVFKLRVTDDKSEAQTFFDSNQYVFDSRGRQYSADSDAATFLKGDEDDTQVNPGITITAKVPFQFPDGIKVRHLVLHDSDFSGGVTVKI
jgi:hypothetical protein